ncbi:hypothetical protein HJC23_000078 [Cyclotella cryptica]|uniref:Secreted protein n=1 Tax=Cyclotella cryptica TaxID=29204 RepID=A0ABD3PMJ9_9STRA
MNPIPVQVRRLAVAVAFYSDLRVDQAFACNCDLDRLCCFDSSYFQREVPPAAEDCILSELLAAEKHENAHASRIPITP